MHNPYKQYDEEENKKRYDLEQKCRAMERNIRKHKKQAECYKTLLKGLEGTPEADDIRIALGNENERISVLTRQYIAFCEEHNLRPLTERLEIAKAERAKNYT